jgi:uncharacterized membrane protein
MKAPVNRTVVNMNTKERILSVAGGASLIAMGVRDFKVSSVKAWAELLSGSFMLMRGTTGYCPVNQLFGHNSLENSLEAF